MNLKHLSFLLLFFISCKEITDSNKLILDQFKDAKSVYKELMQREIYELKKIRGIMNIKMMENLLDEYTNVETKIMKVELNDLEELVNQENKKIEKLGESFGIKVIKYNEIILLDKSIRREFVDIYFANKYSQIISIFASVFCVQ